MLIEIAFHCNTLHLIAALPGLNNFKHFTRYRHVNIHIHLFIIHHGWLCLPFLELPKEAEAKTDKEASGWVFSTVRPRSPKKVWISSDHFFSDENHDIISLWDYMYNYSYIIIYTPLSSDIIPPKNWSSIWRIPPLIIAPRWKILQSVTGRRPHQLWTWESRLDRQALNVSHHDPNLITNEHAIYYTHLHIQYVCVYLYIL